jgi:hypothetical protein
MALVNQGGSLLLRNGALATGQACCCNRCFGPCDGENPCPEGCECVDGQCVAESGDCATNGCPPPEISGDEATVFCCGKFFFNPDWPPEEQFQKGECFPGYNTAYFCLANECSLEDYLAFNCPDGVRAGLWIDTPCGDNGGCPDGSRCVSIRVCPGA